MKFSKIINIASDGSIYFSSQPINVNSKISIGVFKNEDEKSFFFNKKTMIRKFDTKQFSYYKKMYFK